MCPLNKNGWILFYILLRPGDAGVLSVRDGPARRLPARGQQPLIQWHGDRWGGSTETCKRIERDLLI